MIYSEAIDIGLPVLKNKDKYTMRDVNAVMVNSLFKPVNGKTLSESEAVFVVKCVAFYYGAEYSNSIRSYTSKIKIEKA